MYLIALAFALFIVAQLVRLLVFATARRYPDVVEVGVLILLGVGTGLLNNESSGTVALVEGVAAAGLALFLLELYVVALKSSTITIRRNR